MRRRDAYIFDNGVKRKGRVLHSCRCLVTKHTRAFLFTDAE
jgi:hypothetical protein